MTVNGGEEIPSKNNPGPGSDYALSSEHPFPVGTRVRHYGRRWSLMPFATVEEVIPRHDGTYEYAVNADDNNNFVLPGRRWWASYFTYGRVEDDYLCAAE